tara:strand:- start:3032 stop:3766 length:735 start_codon:yes stop_codon:yes gene_type:complete
MASSENLGTGEQEALATARLGDLRKKVNADSWSDNMEELMKQWGEKAAGLRFMHADSGGSWKKFANKLSITGIVVTSVASTVSLVATSVPDTNVKNGLLYGVGAIGLFSTLVQSFKKFYNAEEKAADHASVSKQFGSFYRYMTLQMGMSREDRDPADVLSSWALKEYERLQQEAPSLGGKSVTLFKQKFSKSSQSVPDVAEDEFLIHVYKPSKNLKMVDVVSSTADVNVVVDVESGEGSVDQND